jgi:squalene-hopene/tetraprenyl-beta-curcumene cyclase
MCGLCGVPGQNAFNYIPQLPFELSLLPKRFYRLLNLSVVSYAIPALVAVGIVIFKKKKSSLFWRIVRRFSIKKAMDILRRMLPESGGFLEAIPLTAFVALSLINSGFEDTEVVKKGIQFLKKTQRDDGGWPIDVDLSTWVTSLAVKSYRENLNEYFSENERGKITSHLKSIQNKQIHSFNGTGPGGWGWTNFSGSVPDGDDTPGVILALLKLQPKKQVKNEVLAATKWLYELQNSDGGFPTFSKGWGKLPFDQSCSDLSGHGLLAVSAVLHHFGSDLPLKKVRELENTFEGALKYLIKNQSENGSWLPLWFGNQFTENHTNPVYGTAKVVTYLNDILTHNWFSEKTLVKVKKMMERGQEFLVSVQNEDGCWGGNKNIQGTIEETSLAVSAIVSEKYRKECELGINWLEKEINRVGFKAAPIGLYFASLWYDEKLYPVTSYLETLARVNEFLEKEWGS